MNREHAHTAVVPSVVLTCDASCSASREKVVFISGALLPTLVSLCITCTFAAIKREPLIGRGDETLRGGRELTDPQLLATLSDGSAPASLSLAVPLTGQTRTPLAQKSVPPPWLSWGILYFGLLENEDQEQPLVLDSLRDERRLTV